MLSTLTEAQCCAAQGPRLGRMQMHGGLRCFSASSNEQLRCQTTFENFSLLMKCMHESTDGMNKIYNVSVEFTCVEQM